MNGLFVRFAASGWEVIKVDEGHFPMDHFKHKSHALSYARRMAEELGLPLFEELPL